MKNLTGLGKSLTLTVILGSLLGCASGPVGSKPYVQPGSIRDNSSVNFNNAGSVLGLVVELGTEMKYRLTAQQKDKQTAAVYAALESEYGQVYRWYEDTARGAVKAVHGFPHNAGYCRVIFSSIESKGRVRNFEEIACISNSGDQWKFYPH